jgi:hypothetical protein
LVEKLKEDVEYIPVEVKKSKIEGAGKGLFTTAKIPNNSLVMNYTGLISIGSLANLGSDSIFTYGNYDYT